MKGKGTFRATPEELPLRNGRLLCCERIHTKLNSSVSIVTRETASQLLLKAGGWFFHTVPRRRSQISQRCFQPPVFHPWFAKVKWSTLTVLQLRLMAGFKRVRVSTSMKQRDSNWFNDPPPHTHTLTHPTSGTKTKSHNKIQNQVSLTTMNFPICDNSTFWFPEAN